MSAVPYTAHVFRRHGVVTPDRLTEASGQADRVGGTPLDALSRGGADEMPVALLREATFGFARERQLMPVRDEPDGTPLVALGNPLDTVALDDLRMALRRELEHVVATPSAVLDALHRAQAGINRTNDLTHQGAHDASDERTDILESDEDVQIIRWVNSLFVEAVKERASDVPIQPDSGQAAVRSRIDGDLHPMRTAPRACCPPSWRA